VKQFAKRPQSVSSLLAASVLLLDFRHFRPRELRRTALLHRSVDKVRRSESCKMLSWQVEDRRHIMIGTNSGALAVVLSFLVGLIGTGRVRARGVDQSAPHTAARPDRPGSSR
jgi:hypothetical protein